jgi:hypothetical protein
MRHQPIARAVALSTFVALSACGGSAQDPPDADPAADGVLTLPQSFGIASSASSLQAQPATPPGGAIDYAKAIAEGAGLAAESEQLFSLLIGPLQTLSIPRASTVTTFTSSLTFGNGPGSRSATLIAAIDFADFDLDGDGKPEGCSGHTAALPICLRIWLDGERFLAGRLDAIPNSAGPGAGRLTVRKTASLPGGEDGMGVTVVFDQRDPASGESVFAEQAERHNPGQRQGRRHLAEGERNTDQPLQDDRNAIVCAFERPAR